MTCACWDPGCPNHEPYDRADHDPRTYLDPDRLEDHPHEGTPE